MQPTRYTDDSIRVLTHLSTYPERQACIADIAVVAAPLAGTRS
jgi:hypothetical protein